jgi:hypothetical protein
VPTNAEASAAPFDIAEAAAAPALESAAPADSAQAPMRPESDPSPTGAEDASDGTDPGIAPDVEGESGNAGAATGGAA